MFREQGAEQEAHSCNPCTQPHSLHTAPVPVQSRTPCPEFLLMMNAGSNAPYNPDTFLLNTIADLYPVIIIMLIIDEFPAHGKMKCKREKTKTGAVAH